MKRTSPVLLLAPLALALAVAGCAAPEAAESVAAADAVEDALAAAPFSSEGVVFLPPSQGQEREVTEIPFEVNATGMSGDVVLHLGGKYVIELPGVLADVEGEVRAAAGEVVGAAQLSNAAQDATIALADLVAGPHTLVLLSYGGSDGQGNGDFVEWAISVA